MQLRCTYCQTMFAISRDEMLAGLEHMTEHQQTYYDAHCPKCRRANRVEKIRMERYFPDWQKAIRLMAKEAAQAESGPTPTSSSQGTSSPQGKLAGKPAPASSSKAKTPPSSQGKPALKAAVKPAKAAPASASPQGKPAGKAAPASSSKAKTPSSPRGKPAARKSVTPLPSASASKSKATSSPKGTTAGQTKKK